MSPLPRSEENMGYWGKPTSTLDWCERNYEVTYYIAEFWNTITNLCMIIPPIYGMITCYQQRLGRRYILSYALLLLTGVGSWMFHMTLRFEMQLLDELPMVWGAAFMLYTLHSVRRKPFTDRGRKVGIISLGYAIVLTITYVISKNPLFYQIMYGLLVFTLISYTTKYNYAHYKKTANQLFLVSLMIYVIGFTLWNIDNTFCDEITYLREDTNLAFLSPFTQLHGWWHIMAGYAGYLQVLYCIQHQLHYLNIDYSLKSSWVGVVIRINPAHRKMLFN